MGRDVAVLGGREDACEADMDVYKPIVGRAFMD